LTAEATQTELQKAQNVSGFFRGNVSVIALSGSIRSLGGFVGVYIPLYFVQIGGDPLTLGLSASFASIIQFVALSVGGFLADYYGRRRVIVFAAFYVAFFPLLYAITRDWLVFGILTMLATLGTIANPAVHATVADSISPGRRTMGIAYLQVVSSLPLAVSPLIGGWLIQNYGLDEGFRIACLYAAAFALMSAIPVLVFLRETLRPKVVDPDPSFREILFGSAKFSFGSLQSCLKALMLSYALVMFANGAVAQYYILYASQVAGVAALDWAMVVSLQFVLASVLKIPGGWLCDSFGKRKIMIISLLTTAPAILLFTLSRSLIQLVVAVLLLVAAGVYYAPAYEALQADLTPKSMRGRITALWDMGSAVSAALGAVVGGVTFQLVGPAVPFYVFAAAEIGAALLLAGMVKEPETREI